jgi:hypothetical protein
MAWGAAMCPLFIGAHALGAWLGRPARFPDAGLPDALLGARLRLSFLIGFPVNAALEALAILLLFLILRLATRRDALAVLVLDLIMAAFELASADDRSWVLLALFLLVWGSFVALLLRFGVLAASAGIYTVGLLVVAPHSYDLGAWTGAATAIILPLLVGLAVVAFRNALGGRPELGRYLVGETRPSTPS